MIRHFVFLRFPKDMPATQKQTLFGRLSALQTQLDGIVDFCHRPNISPETPVIHGFSDMFWVDFTDAAARDRYLSDPGHRAVGADLVASVTGGTDGIFVCDIKL